MAFRHPSRRNAALPKADAYGDGGFFFTQPVGRPTGRVEPGSGHPDANDSVTASIPFGQGGPFDNELVQTNTNYTRTTYGDGGYYFLSPVNTPNYSGLHGDAQAYASAARVRQGFRHPSYGVTAPSLKSLNVRGASIKTASEGKPGSQRTETREKDAVAKSDVIRRFEDAANKKGKTKFWRNVYGQAIRSPYVSDKTRTSYNTAVQEDEAAGRAYDTAKSALLKNVPATFDSRGLGTNDLGRAFNSYEIKLIDMGYYAEAYRNVARDGSRKRDDRVFDAIKRDLIEPFEAKKVSAQDVVTYARQYLLADPQSKQDAKWSGWSARGSVNGKAYTKYFERDVFMPDFKARYQSERTKQDGYKNVLVSGVTDAKAAFEQMRKDAIEGKVASEREVLAQQNAAAAANSSSSEARRGADTVKGYAATALAQRSAAETAASSMDVAGATTAATNAAAAAQSAEALVSRVKAASDAAARSAAASGGRSTDAKTNAAAAYNEAALAAQQARTDADTAYKQIEVAGLAKAAADKTAAEEQAKKDEAEKQRLLDEERLKVANGAGNPAAVAELERQLADAKAKTAEAKAASDAADKKVEDAKEAAKPPERESLLMKPKMEKVGFGPTSATGEGLSTTVKVALGVGVLAAAGGAYWWFKIRPKTQGK
jgi:hypothetical protein